jgi:gluconate transporter
MLFSVTSVSPWFTLFRCQALTEPLTPAPRGAPSPSHMPLLWLAVGVALILVLVTVAKLDAFFALVLASFAVGLLNGMDLLGVLRSVLGGIGTTLGNVALILVLGTMLGALVDSSGAAHVITSRLTSAFGVRRIQLAMALTGLLVGLPMLYNAGFLLLIPLVYAVAAATGLSLVRVGVPLAAALSVAHGFTPPHPAPTFVAFAYGADVNLTLLAGIAAAVPACLVGGVLFARWLPETGPVPAAMERLRARPLPASPPGFATSVLIILVPVMLMLLGAVVDVVAGTAGVDPMRADGTGRAQLEAAVPDPGLRAIVTAAKFLGNANVALLVAVLVALWVLGVRRGRTMPALMQELGAAVGAIAMILLVIAAGGAFSQVLRDAGVAQYVTTQAAGLRWNPLLLAFGVASLLRFAVGSATVAGMTTAGIMAPAIAASGTRPELMVLATGAGSLMFSHFNDTGFWMFKEYFGLTIRETFATWSVMEMIVAIVGLLVALLLQAVL